jgi:hypothetical protein
MPRYRETDVCIGSTIYRGLLRLPVERRSDGGVNPWLTRTELDRLVREMQDDFDPTDVVTGRGLWAEWEGVTLVVADRSPEGLDLPAQRVPPNGSGLYRIAAFDTVGTYDWTWYELPSWPSDPLDADAIVRILASPPTATPMIVLMELIAAAAEVEAVAAALLSTDDTVLRERLCQVLQWIGQGLWARERRGDLSATESIPALAVVLGDPNPGVRFEAADAIGRILWREGAEAAGQAYPGLADELYRRLVEERDGGTIGKLAVAVAHAKDREAVPYLIELLGNESPYARAEAATALGVMRASESTTALRAALTKEHDRHAIDDIRWALEEIES